MGTTQSSSSSYHGDSNRDNSIDFIKEEEKGILEKRIKHLEETCFVKCNDEDENDGDDNAKINVQMGIVIVPQMSMEELPDGYSVDDAAKKFATTIHDEWGVGQTCNNNGSNI